MRKNKQNVCMLFSLSSLDSQKQGRTPLRGCKADQCLPLPPLTQPHHQGVTHTQHLLWFTEQFLFCDLVFPPSVSQAEGKPPREDCHHQKQGIFAQHIQYPNREQVQVLESKPRESLVSLTFRSNKRRDSAPYSSMS